MRLTVPQTELFMSEAKATAFVSGFGAGKTVASISRMLATKFTYPKVNILYGAPTYSLIRDILYPDIAEELESQGFQEGFDFQINESKHTINIKGCGKILCKTLEKPERLIGFQVGDAFLDEFDILPKDKAKLAWRKVLARTRQKFPDGKKNQVFVTTTPEGFKETYRLFVKETPNDYKLINASTYSNPHLPEDYIQTLLDTYPRALVEAYINGQFVNLSSGSVYYGYDRDKCNTHYLPKPRETLHIGMDFNVYKMASIIHIKRDGKLYAVGELMDLRDTPDMILAIREKYPDHPIIVYPDSSGKSTSSKGSTLSDHRLLKDAGFRIKVKSTNPRIKDRLISMNGGFDHGRYFVNVAECPIYVECLEQQVFDKNGLPDKTSDQDHAPDAGGYCVHSIIPVLKRTMSNKALGGF